MTAVKPSKAEPALDPEAEALLRSIQSTGFTSWSALGLENGRAAIVQMAGVLGGAPEQVLRVDQIAIPRPDGSELNAFLYIPAHTERSPIMIYMHGGGWVLGNYTAVDSVVRALANRSGCSILSIDYRLAPEHKFPAAFDDVMTALRWAADHAAEWGLDSSRLAVGGDSSGANLAAAASLSCSGSNSIRLIFQLLVYPCLDHNYDRASYASQASGRDSALSRADVIWFHNHYVTRPEELDLPAVSPLRAEHFTGLPPTLLISAEFDPLLDEGTEYAGKLLAAGVKVDHQLATGVFHGFWRMPGVLSKAREWIDYAGNQMRLAMPNA